MSSQSQSQVSSVICLPSICEYQWSQLARIRTPPIGTSDFLYVRFIGDISIDEKDFGKIQKDRVLEMKKWAGEIKKVGKGNVRGKNKEVRLAMIAANNHYAGFGPGTVNLFRKLVGLSELSWEDSTNTKATSTTTATNKRRNKISMLTIQE